MTEQGGEGSRAQARDGGKDNVVELRPGVLSPKIGKDGAEETEADDQLAQDLYNAETERNQLRDANALLVDEKSSLEARLHEARTGAALLTAENMTLRGDVEQARADAVRWQQEAERRDAANALLREQVDADARRIEDERALVRERDAQLDAANAKAEEGLQQVEFERGRVHALQTQLDASRERTESDARLLSAEHERADGLAVQLDELAARAARSERKARNIARWLSAAVAALTLGVVKLWP